MKFLNGLIGFAMSLSVVSAGVSSNEIAKKMSSSQRSLFDFAADAFKSDRFIPVGSSADKSLQATVYSLTGSIYQSMFYSSDPSVDSSSCSSLAEIQGIPVNMCTVGDGYSFKFQLTGDSCTGLVIQYFNDRLCEFYIGQSSGDDLSQGLCQASQKNYTPPGTYVKTQCTTSSAPALLPNGLSGELYNSANCTGRLMAYSAVQLNYCNPEYNPTFGNFSYYTYGCNGATPTFVEWPTNTCTGTPVIPSTTIDSVCTITTNDSTDDGGLLVDDDEVLKPPPSASTTPYPTSVQDGSSSNLFCPVQAPTRRPASLPTAFPTANSLQSVSFNIKQQLNGIYAATLMGSTTNINVLKATIAGTMTGVAASDIVNLAASDYYNARRLGASMSVQAAGTNIVALSYTVSVQSIYSFTQLYDLLLLSVYSGGFTTDLNTNARNAGATDMYDTSSPAVISPIDFSIDMNDDLSGGAIAGIVIGSVVFFLLVVGIVYYCFCRRPATAMSTHGAKAGVEL